MCVCVCGFVCVCVYSYISILQLKFELIVSLFSRTRISLPVLSSIFHFFLSPFLFTPTISLSRTCVMSVYVARCLLLLRRRNSLPRPLLAFLSTEGDSQPEAKAFTTTLPLRVPPLRFHTAREAKNRWRFSFPFTTFYFCFFFFVVINSHFSILYRYYYIISFLIFSLPLVRHGLAANRARLFLDLRPARSPGPSRRPDPGVGQDRARFEDDQGASSSLAFTSNFRSRARTHYNLDLFNHRNALMSWNIR